MAKENNVELKGTLGVVDGWAIGTGAMVGVTIFTVSGTISGLAGPAACLGFVVAAAIVFCVALCYCEIASLFPGAGGAYVFPKKVIKGELGHFLSFLSGWSLWGGQGLGPVVVTITTVNYLNTLLGLLGIGFKFPITVTTIVLTLLYFLVNAGGQSGGRAVQLISTFAVVAILVLYIIWGGVNMKPELLTPFMPNGAASIIPCAAACILSFSGWSTIPNMSEEFKNPERDVPMASLLCLATCALIFALFVYVMNGLLPGSVLADEATPPVAAMNTFTTVGAYIITFGGLFACISTSNGLLMTGSRIPFAMGRSGDLPKGLGKVNAKGICLNALILTTVGQIALALTGSMVYTLVSLTVCATIVSWVLTVISSLIVRYGKKVKTPFHAFGYPVVPIIAIAGLIFMFTRLAKNGIIMTIVWDALGIIVFFLFQKTGLKKMCNEYVPEEVI